MKTKHNGQKINKIEKKMKVDEKMKRAKAFLAL